MSEYGIDPDPDDPTVSETDGETVPNPFAEFLHPTRPDPFAQIRDLRDDLLTASRQLRNLTVRPSELAAELDAELRRPLVPGSPYRIAPGMADVPDEPLPESYVELDESGDLRQVWKPPQYYDPNRVIDR